MGLDLDCHPQEYTDSDFQLGLMLQVDLIEQCPWPLAVWTLSELTKGRSALGVPSNGAVL